MKKIDDIEGSDYINADFVNGGLVNKQDKRFICAQGPTQKTVPDFWRMIYEQQCWYVCDSRKKMMENSFFFIVEFIIILNLIYIDSSFFFISFLFFHFVVFRFFFMQHNCHVDRHRRTRPNKMCTILE